jgi:hypothetical protein
VKRRIAQEEAFEKEMQAHPERMDPKSPIEPLPMLSIPYYECRQIMTRPDFMDGAF